MQFIGKKQVLLFISSVMLLCSLVFVGLYQQHKAQAADEIEINFSNLPVTAPSVDLSSRFNTASVVTFSDIKDDLQKEFDKKGISVKHGSVTISYSSQGKSATIPFHIGTEDPTPKDSIDMTKDKVTRLDISLGN